MPANLKTTKKSELKPISAANELAIKPTMLLVLGMHRSGSSVTARLLECLGAQNSGLLMSASEGNPHGYFEDQEIYAFNEGSLLPRLGRAWHSTGFVDWTSLSTADRGKYALQALEVLRKNYPLSNSLSVLKEPRIGILLPFWLSVFQHAGFNVKVVCAVRDPVSVIRSLSKAQGLSLTHGGMLYVNYWLSILSYIQDLPVAFVQYDEIFANPSKSLRGVAQKLALPFPEDFEEQVHRFSSSFFDKDLRHSSLQSQDLALEADLPPLAIELYESLLAAAQAQNVKKTAKFLEMAIETTESLQPAFLEFDRLFSQFHSANQRANELNSALEGERSSGHRELLAEVAAEKEQLSQELARLVGEVAHHRDQLSHQSHELESFTHEASQQRQLLEDERARLTQENETARLQAIQLTNQHAATATEAETLRQQLEESTQRIAVLEQESAETHRQMQEQVTHLNDQLSHQSHELESFTHEASQQHNTLVEQIGQLETERKQADASIIELQRENHDLSEEKLRFKATHRELEANIEERFRELAEMAKMIIERDTTLEASQADIEQSKQASAQLQQEIENLRYEGMIQQATIQEIAQQKDTLSELIRQRDEECANLKNNVDQRFCELAELSKMYLASEERGGVAVADNIKLKKSISWKTTAPLRFPNQLLKKLSKQERVLRNQREIILKSGLFDEDFYLQSYPDVAACKLDPIRHYLLFGAKEGRNPNPSFNTLNYLSRYPDVQNDRKKINPLIHYVLYGKQENRYSC